MAMHQVPFPFLQTENVSHAVRPLRRLLHPVDADVEGLDIGRVRKLRGNDCGHVPVAYRAALATINKATQLGACTCDAVVGLRGVCSFCRGRRQVLMTEDMQDGRVIHGPRLMNPFAATNAEAVKSLLSD
jgi:hypothetical protein